MIGTSTWLRWLLSLLANCSTWIPASIGGRRGKRHEECFELLPAPRGKLGEPPCGRCALTAVHRDGFWNSCGSAVV